MTFHRAHWIVLFLISSNMSFLEAENGDARLKEWRQWRESIFSWDYDCVTISSSKPNDPIERSVGAEGSYFRSQVIAIENGMKRQWVRIINDDYAAELERLDDSDWVVQRLHFATDAEFEGFCKDLRGADYFRTKFLNPADVWSRISENSNLEPSSADTKSVGYVLASKAVDAGSEASAAQGLRTVLYFEHEGQKCPTRMDLDLKEKRTVTIEYSRSNDGIPQILFDACRMWVPGVSDTSTPPTETTTITRMALNSSIDRTTCYLAAYGLPEPVGLTASKGNLWWWVVGIIVALSGFMVWKRATP